MLFIENPGVKNAVIPKTMAETTSLPIICQAVLPAFCLELV